MNGLYVKFSTAWPRKPEFRQAGPMARLIYVEMVMFCKENLTDGAVHAANLADFAVDVPRKKAHMTTLVDVGAIETTSDGWRIPPEVWNKWNPTKAEVEAKKEDERKRKAEYRNRRMSQDGPDDVPMGQESVSRARPTTPESEPESQPEPESESESETSRRRRSTGSTGGGQHGSDDDDERVMKIAERVAALRLEGKTVKSQGIYARKVLESVIDECAERIITLTAEFPSAPDTAIAAAVHSGETRSLGMFAEAANVIELPSSPPPEWVRSRTKPPKENP